MSDYEKNQGNNENSGIAATEHYSRDNQINESNINSYESAFSKFKSFVSNYDLKEKGIKLAKYTAFGALGLAAGLLIGYCSGDRTSFDAISREEPQAVIREVTDDESRDEFVRLHDDSIEQIVDELSQRMEDDRYQRETREPVREQIQPQQKKEYEEPRREEERIEEYTRTPSALTSINDLISNPNYFQGNGELNATIKYHENGSLITRYMTNLTEQDIKNLFKLYEETATFYDDGTININDETGQIGRFRVINMPMGDGNVRVLNPGYVNDENSKNLELLLSQTRNVELDSEGKIATESRNYRLNDSGFSEGSIIFADLEERENISDLSEEFTWNIKDSSKSVESSYSSMLNLQNQGYRTILSFPESGRGKIIQTNSSLITMPSFSATRIGEGDNAIFKDYQPIVEDIKTESRIESSRERSPKTPERDPRRPEPSDPRSPETDGPDRTPSGPGFTDDAQGPTDRNRDGSSSPRDGMGGLPNEGPRDVTRDRDTRSTPSERDQGNDRRDAVNRPVRRR